MLTTKLADCIQSISYETLPEKVVDKTKECLIDFFGVAFPGSQTRSGKAVYSLLSEDMESSTYGYGVSTLLSIETIDNYNENNTPHSCFYKTTTRDAALTNGIFAHSMDLDDGHRMAQLHPGACVIPAALAICEAQNSSGKELIESIVTGYQVAIELGMMVNPEHRNQGFHSTGTCGTMGAAAAACKALGLKKNKIINALGLAGTQAAGLLESDHSGSMGKHLHTGKAAHSGVLAAQLAQKGYTGADTIIEGSEGFITAMATKLDGVEINNLTDAYRILEVYFKLYPVCRHLHSSIDALSEIIIEEDVIPEDIKEITIETYQIASEHNNYHPQSAEAVKQSLPFSLAIKILNEYNSKHKNDAYLNNDAGLFKNPESYNKDLFFYWEFINDKDLKRKIEKLSKKIIIKKDDVLESMYPSYRPSRVSVVTYNGVFKNQVNLPYGEPESPLNRAELYHKFLNLNPKLDMEVITIIEDIDSYRTINQFTSDLNSFL